MPVVHASRNVQAKRLAMKMAILGGITLAAIIGIAIFLIVHMS
jgi:hypothetical protein